MTVLRDNKDSLMAVLEAFVYDPLINWRLLQAEEARQIPPAADRKRGLVFCVISLKRYRVKQIQTPNERVIFRKLLMPKVLIGK